MSEHQFNNVYRIGYEDGRKSARQGAALLLVAVACLAFWAGRASLRSEVGAAYEAGFDAGAAERTTDWGEWR